MNNNIFYGPTAAELREMRPLVLANADKLAAAEARLAKMLNQKKLSESKEFSAIGARANGNANKELWFEDAIRVADEREK